MSTPNIDAMISTYLENHAKTSQALNEAFERKVVQSRKRLVAFAVTHVIMFIIAYALHLIFGPLWVLFASWGILAMTTFLHELCDDSTLSVTNVRLNFIQLELNFLAGLQLFQSKR
jgi:hypothetical protein